MLRLYFQCLKLSNSNIILIGLVWFGNSIIKQCRKMMPSLRAVLLPWLSLLSTALLGSVLGAGQLGLPRRFPLLTSNHRFRCIHYYRTQPVGEVAKHDSQGLPVEYHDHYAADLEQCRATQVLQQR